MQRFFLSRHPNRPFAAIGAIAVLHTSLASPLLARGLTTKPDEKRVVRVARLTHPAFNYVESHHCILNAFNRSGDRVVLWRGGSNTPAEWGFLGALAGWTDSTGFAASRHVIPTSPDPPSGGIPPQWSEAPGEDDILYWFNRSTSYVLRVDLTAGTCSNWVALTAPPTGWGSNFFIPGFSSDGNLIVWEDPDDTLSGIWEVDVVARTALRVPQPPPLWSAEWKRYPFNGHGHSDRSPDGTKIFGSSAPDIPYGYAGFLRREGQASLGLLVEPKLDHACWRNTDRFGVFGDVDHGDIYQLWTDGTFVKLLDVRVSRQSYYREDSWPNVNRDGSGILYTSDGGNPTGNISVFYASLEDANAGSPVGIESFESSPAVTLAGQPVALAWSTVNAGAVRIAPDPGPVPPSGSVTLTPATSTTYLLTAEGAEGPVSRSLSVVVNDAVDSSLVLNGGMESGVDGQLPSSWYGSTGAARIGDGFLDYSHGCVAYSLTSADQAKIWQTVPPALARQASGHRVKLTAWFKSTIPTGHRGDFLSLNYGNPRQFFYYWVNKMVPAQWRRFEAAWDVPIWSGDTLGVTVSGASYYHPTTVYIDRVSLAVEDVVPAPAISDFDATPATIDSGGAVGLHWSVEGAASVRIDPGLGVVESDAGVRVLGGDLPAPSATTTYTLTADNGAGESVSRAVTVYLSQPATAGVDGPERSAAIWLAPPAPNPTAGPARLRFGLARAGRVSLALFDLQGRRVRLLVDSALPAGPHTVDWDGRDGAGRHVAAGLYFVRMEVEGRSLGVRLAHIR
ncbi:MAG: hypothetical protein A2W00_14945 [Candidatus Eisenbacteria bacterium RBG_16_71_46]|nr:MAG: hypothetical protein A2W00_14945 [Candidatus Eisenbacteria bacterium RBG_16_71_46]